MEHRHAILLVDDHRDGLDAMQALIEAEGFDVVGSATGEEALAKLRGGLACCLIILDWRMPGLHGERFYETVSADPRLACIPLLVLTGDPGGATRARALGIRHVALKPVDPSRLLEIIGEHCTRSGSAA